MKCPECGYENAEDALSCSLCQAVLKRGAEFTGAQNPQDTIQKNPQLGEPGLESAYSNKNEEEEKQLKSLVTFHYIVAGLVAFFSCFFIIHLIIGITALVSPQTMKGSNGSMPPPIFGWIFVIM